MKSVLWTAGCVMWLVTSIVRADSADFPRLDNGYPYGPGSRVLRATAALAPSESTSNVTFTVFYSDRRADVAGMTAGCPQGRAKVTAGNGQGQAELQFIFPHTDNDKPNDSDKKPVVYPSGRKVYYRIAKQRGGATTASDIVEFQMPDKLTIANFGDSYASGEGAPYSSGGKWDNPLCHRSGNSGQAKAVKEVKRTFPELAIAFKNVACSGAEIEYGLLKSQRTANFLEDATLDAQRVPPQFQQVASWLEGQHYQQLNIALFSVGGNDVNFGTYVAAYLIRLLNFNDDAAAKQNLTTDIKEVAADYDELKQKLDEEFDYDSVIITGYPDLLTDKNGALCDGRRLPTDYGLCWGPIEISGGPGPFSTSPEAEYNAFKNVFVNPINDLIARKARSYDRWHFVSTTAPSHKHGLCNCDSAYFNTLGLSVLQQGDPYGTAHPNRAGHERIFKTALVPALTREIKEIKKHYAIERAKDLAREKAEAKVARANKKAAHPVFTSKISAGPAVTPVSADTAAKAKATAANAPPPADAPDNRTQEEGG